MCGGVAVEVGWNGLSAAVDRIGICKLHYVVESLFIVF